MPPAWPLRGRHENPDYRDFLARLSKPSRHLPISWRGGSEWSPLLGPRCLVPGLRSRPWLISADNVMTTSSEPREDLTTIRPILRNGAGAGMCVGQRHYYVVSYLELSELRHIGIHRRGWSVVSG